MLPRITVEARLIRDPELRFAPSGTAVVRFDIACNDRKKNPVTDQWEDVNPTFFSCTAFKTLAENIAESFQKGDLVLVTGKLQQEKYTTKDGEERTRYQVLILDSAAACVNYATVTINRAQRGGQATTTAAPAPMVQDPWATPAPAANLDEPPY